MLRRQYYLDASESHARFLTSASSAQSNTLYSTGMAVGIISFSIGLIILAFMEFLKLKIDHDTLSVGPSIGHDTNLDMVEDFDGSDPNGNRSSEIRSGELVHGDRHKVQDASQQQQRLSVSGKKGMPAKLMEHVAQRNAAQQQAEDVLHDVEDEEDDDEDYEDFDFHSDEEDSVYSFPSALSDMSEG